MSSSRRANGVTRRTTIDEDFYNTIVTTATSKNKYVNYDDDDDDDDESNDSNTDTDSGDVQPTT